MPGTKKKVIAGHRQRMKERGFIRLEVQVRKEDAALLRLVAGALSDSHKAADARALLREHFAESAGEGRKALLARAPLEGIDLERSRDTGRTFVP